jgi:catechol 2,3-dioxygenase-like lactoylglutathione lyase family enzyme
MKVDGLHHVTAITADIEANLDFYGRLLGLRLVWQGVNADDPEMRHVAYGDERGTPGSVVTFFDMPGVAPGRPRLLLRVADPKALDFWERRLARAHITADRAADRLLEPGQVSAGTMHHVAFAIRDGEEQRWRDRVATPGLRPTPVMDRETNKSAYFREPSRVLFDLATDQPGFVFEPADSLGESLMLVGDLENRRAKLEQRFPPLANPRGGTTDWSAAC